MPEQEISKLAREIKEAKDSKDVLETLIFIKNGWTGKSYPQGEIQLEHVKRNICPFCLNNIDWRHLEALIEEYTKHIENDYKKVKKINSEQGFKK